MRGRKSDIPHWSELAEEVKELLCRDVETTRRVRRLAPMSAILGDVPQVLDE
jgi:hypothetical protein